MSVKLVTYDLNSPGQKYSQLYEAIKGLGTWWHCVDSTWLVRSNSTTAQIRDHLKQFIDTNDHLVVLSLGGGWATSGLSKECNDWLRNEL